jgi:hypothetical protein
MTEIKSTCCYCGVGCGVLIATDGAQITGVRGDPEHPANAGKLCSKGSTLHLSAQPVIQQQVRALYPEIRTKKSSARAQRLGQHAESDGRKIRRDDTRAWAGQRRLLYLGTTADGRLLRLQ